MGNFSKFRECGGDVEHERDDEQWHVDVPELRPTTTKFRVGVGRCSKCKRRVQGHHPDQTSDALGAAGSQIGPVLKGWAMWLHYRMGLSFGRTAEVLARLGVNVTAGAICQSSAHAACTDLVPVHAELVRRANRSKTLTIDETGWRVGGQGKWLWVAANSELTLCWVADGRGFAQATEVIDAGYAGVLVRDGYVIYNNYEQAKHQSCVAHLARRCREMEADLPRADRKTPGAAKAILQDALAARELPPSERAGAAVDLAARLDRLCARWSGRCPGRGRPRRKWRDDHRSVLGARHVIVGEWRRGVRRRHPHARHCRRTGPGGHGPRHRGRRRRRPADGRGPSTAPPAARSGDRHQRRAVAPTQGRARAPAGAERPGRSDPR